MFKKVFVLILVLCLIFVLIGSAEEKSVLDKVLDSGKLTVGVFSDSPPNGFLDEKNEYTGSDIDVAKLMAKTLGVKVEFVSTINPNRIPYLLTGKVDCVIAGFSMMPDRRKVIEFSDGYFMGGAVVIVNTKNPISAEIEGIQDLAGKKVGVAKGSINDEIATKEVGKTAKSIVRFDYLSDLYQALDACKVDAIIESPVNSGYIIKNKYPYFKMVGDLLNFNTWGIGVRRGDQIWLNWINGFVFDLLSSGDMKRICEKYGVPYYPLHFVY